MPPIQLFLNTPPQRPPLFSLSSFLAYSNDLVKKAEYPPSTTPLFSLTSFLAYSGDLVKIAEEGGGSLRGGIQEKFFRFFFPKADFFFGEKKVEFFFPMSVRCCSEQNITDLGKKIQN